MTCVRDIKHWSLTICIPVLSMKNVTQAKTFSLVTIHHILIGKTVFCWCFDLIFGSLFQSNPGVSHLITCLEIICITFLIDRYCNGSNKSNSTECFQRKLTIYIAMKCFIHWIYTFKKNVVSSSNIIKCNAMWRHSTLEYSTATCFLWPAKNIARNIAINILFCRKHIS